MTNFYKNWAFIINKYIDIVFNIFINKESYLINVLTFLQGHGWKTSLVDSKSL